MWGVVTLLDHDQGDLRWAIWLKHEAPTRRVAFLARVQQT